MNAAVSFQESGKASDISVDTLIAELDRYRQESRWLQHINALHERLAGATDVPSVIEAFSVWLNSQVSHDLLGYQRDDGKRTHILCSCHGPERRLMRRIADDVFARGGVQYSGAFWDQKGYYVGSWNFQAATTGGRLVLLRQKENFGSQEAEHVDSVLPILTESLQRALAYEDLFDQARRDTLTGLKNRRVFEEHIGSLVESARRYGRPLTIASMDLDNFKQLNDLCGHSAGDLVLQQVASTMAGMVRASDLLVRMGGDEFLLVLPDTELASARKLAERLCAAVDGLGIASQAGMLGVSIGLVQWDSSMGLDEWLQRADEILYQAKSNGRARVCS